MSDEKDLTLDELLVKEAETHDPKIQYYISEKYKEAEDYINSFNWTELSAAQNYPDGIARLAWHYLFGNGCKQNEKKAFELTMKAAKANSPIGLCNAGYCYSYGKGVKQDNDKALEYYKKSADLGLPVAINNLLQEYSERGDYEELLKWLTKSADNGNIESQNRLGNCYFNGDIIEPDYEKACHYYTLAADNGYASSQSNLGVLFYDGYLGKPD